MNNQTSRTIVQENNVLRLRPTPEPTASSSSSNQPSDLGEEINKQSKESQQSKNKKKKKSKPKVRWSEDTVDNEHMNKKKTKICCIFH
ncbi:Type 1 phosphatases regulator YPI2, partial [Candida tropicalis]